jgi:putative ABC transport system ATP-binding protein
MVLRGELFISHAALGMGPRFVGLETRPLLSDTNSLFWRNRILSVPLHELAPTTPLSPPAALTAEGVTKRYGKRLVLDAVSLSVAPGERLALMGPSGSGKTTLLNCIGGVDRPDSGSIWIGADDLVGLDSRSLARIRRVRVGTVFQFFHLLPTLTVAENIEISLQLVGAAKKERRTRVEELLLRVELADRADALPSELSGGEQQRIAIARALAHRPCLVLADEPTGNLDSASGANILGLLREMSEASGAALVLVTHSEEAASICHRRLYLRDGRIVGRS